MFLSTAMREAYYTGALHVMHLRANCTTEARRDFGWMRNAEAQSLIHVDDGMSVNVRVRQTLNCACDCG